MDDVLTLDRAAVFEPAKDRPHSVQRARWSEVLLTLDRDDFGGAAWWHVLRPIDPDARNVPRTRTHGRQDFAFNPRDQEAIVQTVI